MTINLPVSLLVDVAVNLTPAGAQAPALNTGLVLGTSTVIDVVSRMREYATLAGVAADFGTTAEEYLAAVLWFGQSPQPTSLNIGRWAKNASAGQLIMGALTPTNTLISSWTGITAGSFAVNVDGAGVENVTGLDFSAAGNLNAVAAIIQAGIQGIGGPFATATCVYSSVYNRFTVTSGSTGSSSTVSFLTPAGVGTDISSQLEGLSSSPGAYVANGIIAESALAAVELFDNQFAGQWYNLFIPSAVDSDHVAIAPYIDGDATPHFYWINTQEVQVLSLGDTTHIGYLLQQLQSQHTAWQYSSTSLYAVWSMAARIATVNWQGSLTALSLMYKTEPSVTPETLTVNQRNALLSYNGNVYDTYSNPSGVPLIEPGICPSGQFIDTIIGVDWLRTQIQSNIFNILLDSETKIPQTDPGVNQLVNGASAACAQGVVNGLLAAGVWNSGGFGQLTEGQWLDKGYYIYAQPIASQAESQRQARISPPIQVAAKLAGAIDTVSVTVTVNQ
jgi:Protein of unknown function (DUF3383)